MLRDLHFLFPVGESNEPDEPEMQLVPVTSVKHTPSPRRAPTPKEEYEGKNWSY